MEEEKISDIEQEYYLLVKKVFDILAPFYDPLTKPFLGVRNKVVRLTDAKNGSKILDVATGTGQQANGICKKRFGCGWN